MRKQIKVEPKLQLVVLHGQICAWAGNGVPAELAYRRVCMKGVMV